MVNSDWVPEYGKNLISGQLNTRQYGWHGGRNSRKSGRYIIFPLIVNMAQTYAERALAPKVNVKKPVVRSN